MARPLPVVKGTLDLLVLKALTWAPMHGFELRGGFDAHAGGELAVWERYTAVVSSLLAAPTGGA